MRVWGQDFRRGGRGGRGVVCGRGRAWGCLVHDYVCASFGNEFGGGRRWGSGCGVGTAGGLEVLDAFFQVVNVVNAGLDGLSDLKSCHGIQTGIR